MTKKLKDPEIKNMKLRNEKFEVSGSNSSTDIFEEVSSNLDENERFVKKLDMQIKIIKKIIKPGEIHSVADLNNKSEKKKNN
jgi:hypothetical protein